MVDAVTMKAIDAIFQIMEDAEKVKKLDDLQRRLGFENDFFSFSSFLDANQRRLVYFLDWYFYDLTAMHPDGEFGGIASYTLYDAAMPYLDNKAYNLKERSDFEAYISELVTRKGTPND